jgi:hypothetical protein
MGRISGRSASMTSRRRFTMIALTVLFLTTVIGMAGIGNGWRGTVVSTSAVSTGPIVPVFVDIPWLLLSAPVKPVGIVDGVMGHPPGPWMVGWYPEFGHLGVLGNVAMAGYLDYWDVGAASFYRLGDVQLGHHVNVTGADGAIYRYEVSSVKTYDFHTAPTRAILSPLGGQSITLITAAGKFNHEAGEYEDVLIIRAIRTDEPPMRPAVTALPEMAPWFCSVRRGVRGLATSDRLMMPNAFASPVARGEHVAREEAEPTDIATIDAALRLHSPCVSVRMALVLADGSLQAVVGPTDPLASRRDDYLVAFRQQGGEWHAYAWSAVNGAAWGATRTPPIRSH